MKHISSAMGRIVRREGARYTDSDHVVSPGPRRRPALDRARGLRGPAGRDRQGRTARRRTRGAARSSARGRAARWTLAHRRGGAARAAPRLPPRPRPRSRRASAGRGRPKAASCCGGPSLRVRTGSLDVDALLFVTPFPIVVRGAGRATALDAPADASPHCCVAWRRFSPSAHRLGAAPPPARGRCGLPPHPVALAGIEPS
jgi:hypothetical protein